jgi:hypothetical protein
VPPATIITSVRREAGQLLVRGVSHDNGEIVAVLVNNAEAKIITNQAGIVDWEISLAVPTDGKLGAFAKDRAGNVEQTTHRLELSSMNLADVVANERPLAPDPPRLVATRSTATTGLPAYRVAQCPSPPPSR